MNNQAKTKLEQLKKLNLPEKAKATLGLIEKLLESEKPLDNVKGDAYLNKLYNQVKEVAAKRREEKTKKDVNEKTIQVKPSDVAAPEEKKKIVKVANEIEDAIDKALKNDPELANFGKSDKRRDAGRKALPAGRRVAQKGWSNQFGKSDGGRVYYENRENRKDRKSPSFKAGYPYLAMGGKIHPMDDEDGTFYVNFYRTKGGNIVFQDEREYKSKASAMTYAMMKRDFMTVDESIFVMNDDGDVLYTSIGTKKMAMGGKFPYQNAQVGDNARVILENKMGTIMVTYGRRFHLRFPDGSEKTYSAEELEFFPTDEMMADGGMTYEQELKMGFENEKTYLDAEDFAKISDRINKEYLAKDRKSGVHDKFTKYWYNGGREKAMAKYGDDESEAWEMAYGDFKDEFYGYKMADGGMMAKGGKAKDIVEEWQISTDNEDEVFDNYEEAQDFWHNLSDNEKNSGQFFRKVYVDGEEDEVEILGGKLYKKKVGMMADGGMVFKIGDMVILKDGGGRRSAIIVEDGFDEKNRVRVRPDGFPMDISVPMSEEYSWDKRIYVLHKMADGGMMADGGVIEEGDYVFVKPEKLNAEVVRITGENVVVEFNNRRPEGGDKRGNYKIKDLKKMVDGGMMADGGETNKRYFLSEEDDDDYYYIMDSQTMKKAPNTIFARADVKGFGTIKNKFIKTRRKYGRELTTRDAEHIIMILNRDTFAYGGMMANGGMMAKGGEVEGVDLFEDYEDQPKEVQRILSKYEMEDFNYDVLQNLKAELESIGYTIDFGLDAEPYDLRKIGQVGKSEFYAKGGRLKEFKVGDKVIYALNGKWFTRNKQNFKSGEITKVEIINGVKLYTIEFKNRFGTLIDTQQTSDTKEIEIDQDEKMADGGFMADGGEVGDKVQLLQGLKTENIFRNFPEGEYEIKKIIKGNDTFSEGFYEIENKDGRRTQLKKSRFALVSSKGFMAEGGMMRTKYDVIYNSYDQETGDMIAEYESVYVMGSSVLEAKNKAMTMLEKGSRDEDFLIVRVRSMMAEGGRFPSRGETVDSKDLNYDMLDYFHRTNKKLLIDTKTQKGIEGGVGKMYGDFVFNGDSIQKKDIVSVKILDDNFAQGGYMAEGENYEYVNTFKRYDSNVPVPQDDFEKLVDAYHKQLSGDKLAVSKYKVLKLQMGNYLGHKTVEEMVEYIEKTHNAHKMAKGGVLKNATYVSKRNINDIKVEINKSIKDLKGADLLDGIYVKNAALKAKFDAYKSYEELSELNGKIWDKLKIESGSQIYASDSLQKKMAIEYQNMGLDAKFKKFSAAQRKKLAEIMTDENEHSLRNYLTLRGYLGQKEYDSYATTYEPKRPYELNPANYKKEMASGGSIGFEGLSKKVAARYEGKNVKAKFQKQYGKTYDKAEAKEVGDKVAGKVYFLQQRKMADGGKMQGFDDRLDESLAERNNRISKMNATFKARRNESKGENKSMGKKAYSSVSTMDKMASGGKIELPHQLDKYFTKPAGTIEVEMSKLIPIRARKSGIDNAEMYMKKAYDGKMAKRKPIEIFKTRNKKYRVNDGNSTYAVAKKNGWETIYAIVVSNPNVTKTGEKSTFTIAKEIRKEGESWSDAIKRVKENRK